MTVAAYRDRITGHYPVTLDTIRATADVLFGIEPPKTVLDAQEMDPVESVAAPIYDPATEILTEGRPALLGGIWRQTWAVSPRPAPEPAPLGPISDRQFFQALAMPPYAIITTQEALDAVKTGEIPPVMQAVIDTLPADQQFAATMLIAGATTYDRTNPLVEVFAASRGMDAAATDAFWRFAEAQ